MVPYSDTSLSHNPPHITTYQLQIPKFANSAPTNSSAWYTELSELKSPHCVLATALDALTPIFLSLSHFSFVINPGYL